MANTFRYLTGECPVCKGIRRDCRENTQTGLIHCRSADVGTIPGFQFVGQDTIGFNMWAINDGSHNDEDREAYRHQRAAERQRRLKEEAKRYSQSLSADERDPNIRKIHQQLGLATRHRQNLRNRGLTDAQIDAGKFFSIDPWQEVSGINSKLAGVDLWGRRLLTSDYGLACPIWDVEGRIIGWQTRLDNATDNKYRWPTSRTKKRPHGATAHLQNGELPITCCRPLENVKRNSIGLAEGVLKPYIAAQKHGQVIVGAAGGNFESSKQQLEAYLVALSAELGTRTVDLYPDASAVTNKTVMRQYRRTIKLITEWGYLVRLAWWGQMTKEQPDIDELTDFDAIAYLTPNEFFALTPGCDTKSSSPRLNRNPEEPNSKAYAQHEAERAERERVELAEAEYRGFGKVKQFLKRLTPKRLPFEIPPPKKLPQVLKYTSGNLPWSTENCPKILYTPEQLSQLLTEAREKGWRDILDSSPTGSGKSFRYATLSSSTLGVDNGGRTWLLSQNHRNPTTMPAEHNFADMVVRTRTGFVEDTDRKTATGRPYLRYPTASEARLLDKGNCHLADLIHIATAKGINNASEGAEMNPVCNSHCKHGPYCGERSGSGFGHRHERRQLFENEYKIRSSIDSLPEPDNYSYEQDAAILDEPLMQLSSVQVIKANTTDFAAQLQELEYQLPEKAAKLAPLKTALVSLLRGDDVPYQGLNHEQLLSLLPPIPEDFVEDTLNKIRVAMAVDLAALLGDAPDQVLTQAETERIASLKAKIKRRFERLQKLQTELTELQDVEEDLLHAGQQMFLEPKFRGFGCTGAEAKKLLERLRRLPEAIAGLKIELAQLRSQLDQHERDRQTVKNFNRRQYQEAKQSLNERIEDLPNQCLVPLLGVWSGSRRGALRISPHGTLSVTVTDTRHNRILDSIKTRYYLDATMSPEVLALYRQIPVTQILQIEQETPPLDNLDFVWVKGFGLAGKNRSNSCDERLKSLHSFLKKKHPDLATFDWKAKKEALRADGHYYSDSTRGSNEFADRSAIAAIGLPMPDVAGYYDLWLTVNTDGSLSFDDFYHQLIDAEIIQAVGRLRANRRPNEKLAFYLIGDTEKCRVANYQPPAQLKPRLVEVKNLCPAAATKSEQAWLGIWELIQRWWTENGELPTQEQISEQSGVNRSWISKLAAQFIGGWKRLKQVIQSLVDPPYNRWNLIEPLVDEDFEWLGKIYLPIVAQDPSPEVAQELDSLIQVYGWHGWLQILSQTSQALRLNLVAALFRDSLIPPADELQEPLNCGLLAGSRRH